MVQHGITAIKQKVRFFLVQNSFLFLLIIYFKKTFSPVWDESISLQTLQTYSDYLKFQHLVACVHDQDESLIGKGVISLNTAVNNPEQIHDFVIRLSSSDSTRGAVCT